MTGILPAMKRLLIITAIVGIAALPALAGCGSSDSASTAADTTASAAAPASGGKTWAAAPAMSLDKLSLRHI